jgi:orotidine-5'-phosphate decarboxylase
MVSRVIVAIDLPDRRAALDLAATVAPHVGGLKVGVGLLYGTGPSIIEELAALGRPVFADAKLHDIPSQVEAAASALAARGARWTTVHAGGGPAMVEAAVRGFGPGVLGVTVLTSLAPEDLRAIGITQSPADLAAAMAAMLQRSGCEGVVSSVHETTAVRMAAPRLTVVTPGIRPVGDTAGDQARVATPTAAVEAGADWLVVGRPITSADDPAAAASRISGEAEDAARVMVRVAAEDKES